MYFDRFTNATSSGNVDLTQYNEIVSNYYIDPTTRVCFQGKHCYDCLVPKWPGYEVSTYPDTDKTIIRQSRGDLRLIEKSATQYGFSIVTNAKTELQFSTSSLDFTLSHIAQGSTRQSFGNFYIQNNGLSAHDIYALNDNSGSLVMQKIYTTTDTLIKAHLGYDKAIWWPTKNFLMVRQYDQITWDGYGLNSKSIDVAANPTNFLPEERFEPFSTGPIKIDGDLPLDARFCNDYLVLWRENTKESNNRITMYSWTTDHFRAEVDIAVVDANTATSLVSFGTSGALLWFKTENTGVLYSTSGSTTTLTVSITDATMSAAWTALSSANRDLRLIQARPDPNNPAQNPQVYAYFTANKLFKVTLNLAATKIVLDPVITLDTRFNLYQPLDIGQIFLANMVIYGCTVPTTNTDDYSNASVLFYNLSAGTFT